MEIDLAFVHTVRTTLRTFAYQVDTIETKITHTSGLWWNIKY